MWYLFITGKGKGSNISIFLLEQNVGIAVTEYVIVIHC